MTATVSITILHTGYCNPGYVSANTCAGYYRTDTLIRSYVLINESSLLVYLIIGTTYSLTYWGEEYPLLLHHMLLYYPHLVLSCCYLVEAVFTKSFHFTFSNMTLYAGQYGMYCAGHIIVVG